jgi:hypothetical protein
MNGGSSSNLDSCTACSQHTQDCTEKCAQAPKALSHRSRLHNVSAEVLEAHLAYSWSSHTGMSGAEARMAFKSTSELYWL